MTRKPKYKIGDIFEIPLTDDGVKGYCRIVAANKKLCLIELYRTTTTYTESIETADLLSIRPMITIWCYNDSVQYGSWNLVGHSQVDGFTMPLFYARDLTKSKGYVIMDENFNIIRRITEEEIGDAQPGGIFDFEAVRLRFLQELDRLGVWTGEIKNRYQEVEISAGIFAIDFAIDIKIAFERRIKRKGADIEKITKKLMDYFSDHLDDVDDADTFYLAIASLQLDYNCLLQSVKNKALEVINSERDLGRWKENGDLYQERKEILSNLRDRLNNHT